MTNIEKAEAFLKEKYNQSTFLKNYAYDREYRLEHAYRVGNIAGEIARKENLNEEALIIAGLLHDISYTVLWTTENAWADHGRLSAKIARPFLQNLDLTEDTIQEMCYGIAIHADGNADFEGEKTSFALSVSDADHLDRLGAYRVYEELEYLKYRDMTTQQRSEYLTKKIDSIDTRMKKSLATKTATDMWLELLTFRKEFFLNLKTQHEHSFSIIK